MSNSGFQQAFNNNDAALTAANDVFEPATVEGVSQEFPDAWDAAMQILNNEDAALLLLTRWQAMEGMSYLDGLRSKALNQPAVYTVLLAPLRGGHEMCARALM